ncbi:unnamed protein product [Didymodactylos carnosus]|uniref:Uncharacterized protein n=1 Tax=Didymodactylos carnosus TaxID=1234261 RepID=A0A814Q4N3_9BILA|nr:unnamed protein product [Didymodactylos carnosus]CAF1228370.1 unnamed protein product [Didymodactylos carnosus]CAF3878707.1 unnamed protein product [Didymodactylos carnosus]CAF4036438.1 unnamed protein product [Didymodactylos carnosus]
MFFLQSFENGPNLLNTNGKDFRDYSIGVLKRLYTREELKSSILPSSAAHIYAKKQLDPKRFKVFRDAVRIKHKISEQHFDHFYSKLLRKTLTDFLYQEGVRGKKKEVRS